MRTMKAAVLVAPGTFDIRSVPVPEIAADEVLIKVERCGICGTDIHIYRGHYAADRLPLVPGHEFAGHVAEVGAAVRGLSPGDPVIADINVGCGTCFHCRRNEVLSCPAVEQIGIHRDGAFAEYVKVPARLVIPLPKSLPLSTAALAEPLACVVRAAKKIGLGMAESVVVLGGGPIGNLHAQLARAIGAAPVIVAELDPVRAALAGDCGADRVVTDPAALKDVVMDLTDGRGADVVIESVGLAALYEQAFGLVRAGGRVAAFGITPASSRIQLGPLDFVLKEHTIAGSVAGMGEDMHQALALLAHGRIRTAPFLRVTRPLDEVQAAIEAFATDRSVFKAQIEV